MHPGHGPGLTARRLGERGGQETVTLSEAQMPNHAHSAHVTPQPGDQDTPSPSEYLAGGPTPATTLYGNGSATLDGTLAASALANTGGSQPHDNLQPFLTMNFIIALVGLYPSRNGGAAYGEAPQEVVPKPARKATPKAPRKTARKATARKPVRKATARKPARKATARKPARKAGRRR